MTVYAYHNYMKPYSFKAAPQSASELVTKPIEKVENVINTTVDTFIKEPEDEEKKKSHKTAITAASSVLVISGIIALLNPQFSGKFIKRLQEKSQKFGKENKTLKNLVNFLQFTNTANASKDIGFKWLCAAKKFDGIKNETLRKILTKIDTPIRAITARTHHAITKGFDKVSKMTIHKKYSFVDKKMNSYEDLLKSYKSRLSDAERKEFETKLNEIKTSRNYFSKEKTKERLKAQEKAMSGLTKDFSDKLINDYFAKFKGIKSEGTFKEKMKFNIEHFKNNMSYWAEDMLMPTRNALEADGKNAVTTLAGDGISVKGKYHEAIDILSSKLNKEEKELLEKELQNVRTKLNKANYSECVEYFDKKRDLVLGGAPTDVLTGVVALGASGVAISTADDKHERVSKAITLAFPAIAGFGTNFALAAMLFSGIQSMALGTLASFGLSKLGSKVDKYINPRPINNLPEVKNA